MQRLPVTLAALLLIAIGSQAHAEFASPLATRLNHIIGINCDATEGGDICTIREPSKMSPRFGYSKQIGLVIPKGVERPSDLVLHIHGHRGVCESHQANALQMIKVFAMDKQLMAANAINSVLIFPVSAGRCATFNTELAPQFTAFTRWITELLQPTDDFEWTISGHSGAYLPINTILSNQSDNNRDFIKRLNAVVMLDATYSSNFNGWKKALRYNSKFRAFSAYKPNSGTENGSLMLRSVMPRNQTKLDATGVGHCQIPNKFFRNYLAQALEDRTQR